MSPKPPTPDPAKPDEGRAFELVETLRALRLIALSAPWASSHAYIARRALGLPVDHETMRRIFDGRGPDDVPSLAALAARAPAAAQGAVDSARHLSVAREMVAKRYLRRCACGKLTEWRDMSNSNFKRGHPRCLKCVVPGLAQMVNGCPAEFREYLPPFTPAAPAQAPAAMPGERCQRWDEGARLADGDPRCLNARPCRLHDSPAFSPECTPTALQHDAAPATCPECPHPISKHGERGCMVGIAPAYFCPCVRPADAAPAMVVCDHVTTPHEAGHRGHPLIRCINPRPAGKDKP